MTTVDTKLFKGDLDKWKLKSSGHLKLVNLAGNVLHFEISPQKFQLTVPEDYPTCESGMLFIDISKQESGFEWLQHLNTYICDNSPTIYKLLCYIEKQSMKNIRKEKAEKIELLGGDVDKLMEDDEFLSKFDVDEMVLRKKLEDDLKNMKSSLTVNIDTNKTTALFTGSVPGNILIKEYLNCKRKYKDMKEGKVTVDLVDNNIYHWKVIFRNFSNSTLQDSFKQLDKKFGYSYLEVHVQFHDKLYPTYPPFIKVVRPRLNNSLMNRITSMKMVQLEYWSPSRNMLFVIDKLYEICNKHISVDVDNDMNDMTKFKDGAYHPLESILVKLASFCDIKDDLEQLDKTEYKKIYNFEKSAKANKTKTSAYGAEGRWKKGTGYGHSGSSNWSISEYVQLQREKDVQVQSILQSVINTVQTTPSDSIAMIAGILSASYIVPFIKSYLTGTTMMEISKHKDIFRLIFTLLQNFASEDGVVVFADNTASNRSLYDLLLEINKEAVQVIRFTNKASDKGKEKVGGKEKARVEQDIEDVEVDLDMDLLNMIITLCEMITPCYKSYQEKREKFLEDKKTRDKKFKEKITDTKKEENPVIQKYKDTLEPLKFDMAKFAKTKFAYSVVGNIGSTVMRRLAKEFGMLSKSLPIFYQSSIFVRIDDENSRCIRVLITGPDDTPYDSGVFLFDVYINENYPGSPPNMIYLNHGGRRFNPNLYACGKVCLSLLGTWRGTEGENWNKETSTLHQLFVSVQSQILIDNPYFNEPGWESSYGTSTGMNESKSYNNYIRYFTMCHAMYDILANSNSYPEFRDIIKKHFTLKKDYILNLCKKWTDEAVSMTHHSQHSEPINKSMYETKFAQLKELLNKL